MNDVLVGSLLGDGSISRCGRGLRYECEQKESMKEYVEWLSREMNEYGLKIGERNRTRKLNGYEWKYKSYRVISKSHKDIKLAREMFYPEGRKTVTEEWLGMLTPKSLAVWYMDDGSYDYNKNTIQIRTDSFTLKEHHLIQNYFNNIHDIQISIAKYGKGKNKKYYLYFPRHEAKKFLEITHHYILKCFFYKKPKGWEKAIALPPAFHRRLNVKKLGEEKSKELLIESLQSFYRKANEEVFPVVEYLMEKDNYSYKSIIRIFGSWERALEESGLPSKLTL